MSRMIDLCVVVATAYQRANNGQKIKSGHAFGVVSNIMTDPKSMPHFVKKYLFEYGNSNEPTIVWLREHI